MELSKEQIDAILAGAHEQMTNEIVASVKQQLQWRVSHQIDDLIAPIVKEFVEKEIVPSLQEGLLGAKGEILRQVTEQAVLIGKKVAEAISAKAMTNLSNYHRDEIVKNLFN